MTKEELTIVWQAVLLSKYSRRSEVLELLRREFRLKSLDPRKGHDNEKDLYPPLDDS